MTRSTGSTRKSGPQANKSRAERPRERIPVDGNRDVLTVYGKDPSMEYRWVKDSSDKGARIQRFLKAGYEFVSRDSGVEVGQETVYTVENIGSIVASPAGEGAYLFLMAIPKEWYQEDQKAKAAAITETENQIKRKRDPDSDENGMYGETKISRKPLL
jgi:hypothetical protein